MEINSSSSEIVVLTGWRRAGKTSLLLRLMVQAIKAGWRVGGLLAPARVEDGQKTGIEVADAHTGERRLLASLIEGELHGPRVGNWTFDQESFVWGEGILKRSLPCDLFVLDELGPLEFEHQQGWSAGFDLLAASTFRLAIVIVRPEYVQAFLERFPLAETATIQNMGEIDRLSAQLAHRYWDVSWQNVNLPDCKAD